jgi:ABC-2 type transport system ATP-binding protein
MIEVKNITKKYGNQIAVDNISFSIKKGEVVGFLGPNGAGKSTTMKIINAYISSDSGTVKVGGVDVSENPIEAKSKIGYLPENNPLYGEMYVREYLEYIADIYKIPYSEIENVITKTGLKKESNKRINQLSKGYKQRVGLAAAIINNPDYLILDEPTTGLDPNQIIEIRNLIKEFGRDKTVLLSTHIMQEVEAMCDRVIIVNNGLLVVDENIGNFSSEEAEICKVVFDEEIGLDIFQKELDVKVLNENPTKKYEFKFDDDDILQRLLEFSKREDINIVEFKISKKSLNDIFRDVTN